MKALSLFSFVFVLPILVLAQGEQQNVNKLLMPSPVNLEISYDDGDTYYYHKSSSR